MGKKNIVHNLVYLEEKDYTGRPFEGRRSSLLREAKRVLWPRFVLEQRGLLVQEGSFSSTFLKCKRGKSRMGLNLSFNYACF